MAGYTRTDTGNNIANGNVIDADDFDAEYNAIESGFNASTGHSHDGSAGEGAPITKMGPSQDLIVSTTSVLPKTTNTLDLGSSGVQFKDAFFDGTIDTDVLTVSGNSTVGGTLGVTGLLTATGGVSGAVTGNVTGTVSDVSNHDTDDISEGSTNLYFTTQRARNSVSATGSIGYDSSTGVMSFTQGNTDTIAEGSTNLYYTTLRAQTDAKTAISVTDSGGDGSLTYSAGTITYTGPSATETRAHFTAGTGVSYSGGQFSIGQSVGTSSNVTFNNAVVNGNLTVNGTTTSVNSNDVNIGDATLTLNSDETGSPTQDAGITIERGTSDNKSFHWDESEDEWSVFGARIKAGTFEGALTGNADTATTLQTSRTIDITGDITATAVAFDGSANIAISASVNNNSHSHTIANVTGLQTEINTKAELAGSTGQAFSASTLNATTVDLGAWTVTQSGTDLKFAYNGTNRMKLDSSGNLTVEGNVTAYGSA
jgi:cytoskeletal protein CcmA (bactofilin family)